MFPLRYRLLCCLQLIFICLFGQALHWTPDGNGYYQVKSNTIVRYSLPGMEETTFLSAADLTPAGADKPLAVDNFKLSPDGKKVLLYTNSQKVWRYKTRGDYWVLDLAGKQLKQIGKERPEASLMFAKLSPKGDKVAYVSKHNIYMEDLATGKVTLLTSTNDTPKLINGTFDWAYEEEFMLRDGFRWSPDGQSIAYWQIDANQIRDFYMVKTTDSVYSEIVPVEYPKVGYPPSPARVGIVNIGSGKTTWMQVPGDPQQHYIVRMEWAPDGQDIVLQQLNRKQNESKLMLCGPANGNCRTIFTESDSAWVSHINEWKSDVRGWDWIEGGKAFVWTTEMDGWRHLYRISRDGSQKTLLTNGNYDVIQTLLIDEANNAIYFYASPDNATQQYLYSVPLTAGGKKGGSGKSEVGKGKAEVGSGKAEGGKSAGRSSLVRLSPKSMPGTHDYDISPNGRYAQQSFSNYYTQPMETWVSLPDHKPLPGQPNLAERIDPADKAASNVSFFRVTTEDGVTMDGWMSKPANFDSTRQYPIVFYVYGEPAGATVQDQWGAGRNFLYAGDMAQDGYIYVSLDNRGTPAPRGREWRKSIYRNIGQLNIRDQAMGAKEILKRSYIDRNRVAVWGWSGGGSSTLNLLFQYPDIYKAGVSIAPVTSSLLYDNIYTERYMGLPQENMEDYVNGAALTHAKNLEGDLLLVHGTTDDNVHLQNAEMLVNELVAHNKQFRYMAYPGRSHGMGEGLGTIKHLVTMYTQFLREHCPPGPVRP